MCLNDRAGDSQTDTKAIMLGSEESFEQALKFAGRKSNTDIRHNNRYISRRVCFRTEAEKPKSVVDRCHGLYPVHHQVHDNLLQLYSISKNRGQADSKIDLKQHALPANLTA